MCWGMYILCIIYIYSLPAQAHTLRSLPHASRPGFAIHPDGRVSGTQGSICPEKVFVEMG